MNQFSRGWTVAGLLFIPLFLIVAFTNAPKAELLPIVLFALFMLVFQLALLKFSWWLGKPDEEIMVAFLSSATDAKQIDDDQH
jgi:hypothetical protein